MDEMVKTDKLDEMYALVPEVNCKGLCGPAYCGPIGMGETERLRILDRIGHPPFSKIFPVIDEPGDTAFLQFAEHLSQTAGIGCLTCPMLIQGQCKVYDIRPMICRIWGAVEDMKCPHGCKPVKYLNRKEAKTLLREACRI